MGVTVEEVVHSLEGFGLLLLSEGSDGGWGLGY